MKENILKILFSLEKYKHLRHILKEILEFLMYIIKGLHLQYNWCKINKTQMKWDNKMIFKIFIQEWNCIIKLNKIGKLNGLIVIKFNKNNRKFIISK